MKPPVLLVAWLLLTGSAAAQALPDQPVTFGGGRVVVGGDVAVSLAPVDEGFFNYSDYEQNMLRQFRVGLSGLVRVTERVSILGELRSENFDHVAPFALYARIRPFPARRLDIQIGRIPPTFGGMSRRAYGNDNPLIGYPLAYQYLTSLRADAAPRSIDELLRMRGRGWLSSFSVGSAEAAPGVPLVSAFRWDTGVQVTSGWRFLAFTGAITSGTTSNPRVSDDNRGKQVAARVTAAPTAGLVIGASASRGEFLGRRVRALVAPDADHDYTQTAYGADVEYSRDHWVVRGDVVMSDWEMPLAARGAPMPLRAVATAVEGRYMFVPGLFGALRAEHLGFSRVSGSAGADEWDAPVSRLEAGAGYYLQRNVLGRVSVQFNSRDGGRVPSARYLTAQLSYWF